MKYVFTRDVGLKMLSQARDFFNSNFHSSVSVEQLKNICKNLESVYKEFLTLQASGLYKDIFHLFCTLQTLINVAKFLGWNEIKTMKLTKPQIDVCVEGFSKMYSERA